MKYLVVSCSLKPGSRSLSLAQMVLQHLQGNHPAAGLIDLSTLELPICDGSSCYAVPAVQRVRDQIANARGIIIAAPVYNYDLSASAKNLVELSGDAWNNKVVGFICAAGGQGSYMSVMSFANSLMLDFRCLIIPRFVYAAGSPHKEKSSADSEIHERVKELAVELERIAEALFPSK